MPNKLNNLKIGEVSFCRKGMNQHARVALFKSAAAVVGPKAVAKATFAECLTANMTADAVNEAFYESFDGLWERNDAFKTALTDELAAGGDGSTASAAYVDSVKALVDEAVSQARSAGATAQDTAEVGKALNAAVEKWLESKKEQTTMKITNRAELQSAVSKFAVATSTVDDMLAIQKAAKDLNAEDVLPTDGPLAKGGIDPRVVELDREIKVLKLSPDARTHYDGLDDAGKTAFLGKTTEQQAEDIAKANSDDPVVYKCKDGTEIRKSEGGLAAVMAKRLDAQDEELAKLRGDVAGSSIEKRAIEQYPNVAKGTAVALLKSAEAVGVTTDEGKDVLKSLDTMNRAGGRLMKRIGTDEGSEADGPGNVAKALVDFDAAVSVIKSRDKCDQATAMSKARVEHPDLWKQAFPDTAEAIEAHEVDNAVAE